MKDILICTYDKNLLPEKQTPGSICWDIKAGDNVTVKPREIKLIPLGIKTALPIGWGAKFYPRSSSPIKRGYTLANNVGMIDADYRGLCYLQVINLIDEDIQIERGERIGQMEIFSYYIGSGKYGTDYIPKMEMKVDEELYEDFENKLESKRGAGGFGSTGK